MSDGTEREGQVADHRADAYFEGEILVLRASSFGRCLGSIVRQGLGCTPEPWPEGMLVKFAEGNMAEPVILSDVQKQGWKILPGSDIRQDWGKWNPRLLQVESEIRVGKNIVIRCHPDAIAQCYRIDDPRGYEGAAALEAGVQCGDYRVVEAKALAPTTNHLTMHPYLWQMSIEMAATGLPGMWAVGTKDKEGNVVSTRLEYVNEPYFTLRDIKARALTIARAIERRDIPECKTRQWPCGFYTDPSALCGQKPAEKINGALDMDVDTRNELNMYLKQWVSMKRVADKKAAQIKEVREKIQKLTEGRPLVELNGVRVEWKKGRQGGVDLEKVKKMIGDAEIPRKPDGADYIEIREMEG